MEKKLKIKILSSSEIKVKNIDHLGIVVRIINKIEIVKIVNKKLGIYNP